MLIFLILTCFFFLGYLAIQLLGLSVGTIILPHFPSFFHGRQNMLINKRRSSDLTPIWISLHPDRERKLRNGRNFVHLLLYGRAFWVLFVFFKVDEIQGPAEGVVSRRMAKKIKRPSFDDLKVNLPYILWGTAFITSFLFLPRTFYVDFFSG